MGTFKTFEDIEAWQLARVLAKEIYILTKDKSFANEFKLIYQMRDSSGSVMDNIAEGFERGGNREFIQFLSISKGSCGELRSQLYRIFDREYISNEKFNELFQKSKDVSSKIERLIEYLNKSEFKGYKFKEPEEPYNNEPNLEP
jgi:four helix bundle protein